MDRETLPPPGVTIPSGMRHYRLPSGEETLDFWGEFLGKVDTDNGDRLRWAELQLYRMIDTDSRHDSSCPQEKFRDMYGKQMWLLYTIGHAVVYHRLEGGCNQGIPAAARDFPSLTAEDPLEPCPDCDPGELADDIRFMLEVPWYSDIPCPDAASVITALSRCADCRDKPHAGRRCRRCGCTGSGEKLSAPGRRLVELVRQSEPRIWEAAAKVRKL